MNRRVSYRVSRLLSDPDARLVRFARQWLDRRTVYTVPTTSGQRRILSESGWDQGDAVAPLGWTCGFNPTRRRVKDFWQDAMTRAGAEQEAQPTGQ